MVVCFAYLRTGHHALLRSQPERVHLSTPKSYSSVAIDGLEEKYPLDFNDFTVGF